MNDYFEGSVRQHLERGHRLLERIPCDLPREFHLLAQTCERELGAILDQLQLLLTDEKMCSVDFQPERLRQFRRLVANMSYLEVYAVAALERASPDDKFLNQLIDHIRIEISYPLLPPVVTTLSQAYFSIHHQLSLLSVPLSEGDFLLHLPDLYHELAHPLSWERHNPKVRPYQDALLGAIDLVLSYCLDEQRKEARRRSPQAMSFYLQLWEKSWWKWVFEFFCDLFAVYTTGPAYVWAHFHLFAKLGDNPFRVPIVTSSTHPADDARMRTLLCGLQLAGFASEAESIRERWDQVVLLSGARPEPEYRRCYPPHILEQLTHMAFTGIAAINCRMATPATGDTIYRILNDAWVEFWRDPTQYTIWERNTVRALRDSLATR